jgi:hypothetical protein
VQASLTSASRRVSKPCLQLCDFLTISNAKFLTAAVLLALVLLADPAYCVTAESPEFPRLFHLVGIPGLRRDERVNLATNLDGLLFETKKVHYQVPYGRIRQVLLLRADRRYEGRTYAAALATYGVGALFILKKHHVDTVILDYVNERGGKMGIVVQMETSQGEHLQDFLQQRGVSVTEPEPPSNRHVGSDSNTEERSKQ